MSERNLKEIILTLLQEHHLLSAGDMLQKLVASGKTYNKTSVYRSLDQLVEEGAICRHYLAGDQAQYELKEDHHIHLVCNSCGKVDEAACDYKQPNKVGSFNVDHHHLTLVGLCTNCSN
jgi:Fur family transcriptional regulator, ferric uptake regulator